MTAIRSMGAARVDGDVFARQTFESIPSGAIVIDRKGLVVLINRAAARILGLPATCHVPGRPCREVLADFPEMARALLDTFETQSPPNRAELDLPHRGEAGTTIGYTLSCVRDADGRTIGAVMLFRDLAPIERLEEQARLRDRLAVLGQIAAGLAHEMRNPLAAIEIHAGLLRRAIDPSLTAHVESIDHIEAETRRLDEAVGTVLDFVRPVDVVAQPVPLEPLLDSLLGEPAPPAARTEREYEPGGTVVLGDPTQLRVAFGNLVRNAREAAGPTGTVRVRTRRLPAAGGTAEDPADDDAGQVVVEVTDDGAGIADEHRPRIFQPFFTTKPKGSGLGLAIVQKIVQGHQGRVDVASQPASGTTFRVVLRAAPGRPW